MSDGKLGGGFGDSSSDELCRYVNLSTNANTFVIRMVEPEGAPEFELDGPAATAVVKPEPEAAPDEDDARSFSFPRPVALLNALTSGCTSRVPLPPAAVDELGAIKPDPPATLLEDAAKGEAAALDDGEVPYRPSFESCAVAG